MITSNSNQIKVAPNPAKYYTVISLPLDFEYDKLVLKNSLGAIIKMIPIQKDQRQVNLNTDELSQGIYWISPLNKVGQTVKLIITK